MIFQLGKIKSSHDDAVREETFQRWREASLRNSGAQPADDNSGTTNSAAQENLRTAEWPDPRATISLTAEMQQIEIQTEIPELRAPEPAAVKPASKLAQFVSSGLNATGLLHSSTKPSSPVTAPVASLTPSASPKTVLKTTSQAMEGVRLVERPRREPELKVHAIEPEINVEDDMRRRFGSNIRSALGPGTIIEGTFSFDSPVCIEGTLIGEVRSNSVLVVGSQATVNAKVKVGSLIVMGIVKGDVESEELVEIKAGGVLEGDVISERFAIEDGGWFQGRCTPTVSTAATSIAVNNKPEQESVVESTQVLVSDDSEVTQISGKIVTSDKWTL
jgi:cytoskeletal protein CcmA (bactofilin family)